MAIQYDTQHQLDLLLQSGGFDGAVRTAILKYLEDDFIYGPKGDAVLLENGQRPHPKFPPTLDPSAQVLYITKDNVTVNTDSDTNLKVIADAAGDATLKVTGSDNVFVAAGPGVDLVNMKGATGNDVVMLSNTIGGSRFDDYGSSGGKGDNPFGGGGDYQTIGGGDRNEWHGGGVDPKDDHGRGGDNGNFTSIGASDHELWNGGGNEQLWGGGGDYPTIGGGAGGEWGGGGGQGGAVTVDAGSGNETLIGNNENDFFVLGKHADQTVVIDGGTAHNTVQFDQSLSDVESLSNSHGVTTLEFYDGQTAKMTDIQTLDFTDAHGKV